MKNIVVILILILCVYEQVIASERVFDNNVKRIRIDLSGDWKFKYVGEPTAKEKNFSDATFDHSAWERMPVPDFWDGYFWWHINPYGDHYRHRYPYKAGIGWYQQTFSLQDEWKDKVIIIHFDAVSTNVKVWCNGAYIGENRTMAANEKVLGWSPFSFDITHQVRFDRPNVLAVRVEGNSNIYGGSGIWQPAWIEITDPLYLEDLYSVAQMGLKPQTGILDLQMSVSNKRKKTAEYAVKIEVLTCDGQAAIQTRTLEHQKLEAEQSTDIKMSLADVPVRLWSPEEPSLYLLRVTLLENGQATDQIERRIGFRTLEIKEHKFYLNGNPYFLRGYNMHVTFYNPFSHEYAFNRMRLYKEANINFTRFHLCPPSQWYLDACDELGILIAPETPYRQPEYEDIYRDANESQIRARIQHLKGLYTQWITSQRNHPCVAFWSLSNEILISGERPESKEPLGKVFTQSLGELAQHVRQLDPSRPVLGSAGEHGAVGEIDDHHAYYSYYGGHFIDSPWADGGVLKDYAGLDKNKGAPMLFTEFIGTYTQEEFRRESLYAYPPAGSAALAYIGHTYNVVEDSEWWQAFLTREFAQVWRRARNPQSRVSGFTVFTDIFYRELEASLSGNPAYGAVQIVCSPVLVSLEGFDRHFYAGQTYSGKAWVINDDTRLGDIRNAAVCVGLFDKAGKELTKNRISVKEAPYYQNTPVNIELKIPKKLDKGWYAFKYWLEQNGKKISGINNAEWFIAPASWTAIPKDIQGTSFAVFAGGKSRAELNRMLKELDIKTEYLESLEKLPQQGILIWGEETADLLPKNNEKLQSIKEGLQKFVAAGNRILVLHPDDGFLKLDLMPFRPKVSNPRKNNRLMFSNIERPWLRIFDDVEHRDMWFWGCDGHTADTTLSISRDDLDNAAVYINAGGTLDDIVLMEVFEQKGSYVLSELNFYRNEVYHKDPLAAKVFINLLAYMLQPQHQQYVPLKDKLVFGDFISESGIISCEGLQGWGFSPEGRWTGRMLSGRQMKAPAQDKEQMSYGFVSFMVDKPVHNLSVRLKYRGTAEQSPELSRIADGKYPTFCTFWGPTPEITVFVEVNGQLLGDRIVLRKEDGWKDIELQLPNDFQASKNFKVGFYAPQGVIFSSLAVE